MATSVNRLTNANVYLNGVSLLGQCESVDIPALKAKMSEHKALGLVASLQLPAGIDKLEAKFKWNSWYGNTLASTHNIFSNQKLSIRGNLETYEGSERVNQVAAKVFLEGSFMDPGGTKFNQHDNIETESVFNVLYFKLEIGDREILEFDATNNIYIVDGVDQLAEYRANLGIS